MTDIELQEIEDFPESTPPSKVVELVGEVRQLKDKLAQRRAELAELAEPTGHMDQGDCVMNQCV